MVKRSTHNRLSLGSIPSWCTIEINPRTAGKSESTGAGSYWLGAPCRSGEVVVIDRRNC